MPFDVFDRFHRECHEYAVAWTVNPPTLDQLKLDAISAGSVSPADRDDAKLQMVLDAAIAYAMRARPELNYDGNPFNHNRAPGAEFVLGVYRQAFRWHTRRKSPDATISMGELGTSRVPSFDPDIERMLGIGRYKGPTFA